MKRLSTDTAHRLVWVAAGEDKEAGSALVTAGKNRGVEASCLISEEGGCVPLLAIVLHTESDKRVVCDLTRTCSYWNSYIQLKLTYSVHLIIGINFNKQLHCIFP